MSRMRSVKNSRESSESLLVVPRRAVPRRASSRHSSRLLLRHAWKSWFHSCRIDFAAYMARERASMCVRAWIHSRCVYTTRQRDTAARTHRYLPSWLPNTIDVYRCALARKRHARTHAWPRVRKSHGDSEPNGIHDVRCQWERVSERATCRASVSISRAYAHGHPRCNGCLVDTARVGERLALLSQKIQ